MKFGTLIAGRHQISVLVAAVVMACLAGVGFAEPDLVNVGGTRISLAPPDGFKPAQLFQGFEEESTGSSIMVTELPMPYGLVQGGMSSAELAKRGMELLAVEEEKFGEFEGRILSVAQDAEGVPFRKWLALFGNDQATVMVVASFPADFLEELGEPMKEAVLSAQFDQDAQIGMFDGLKFRIEEVPELKIANRMVNMLLLTRDGQVAAGPEDPLLVVGSAFSEFPIEDIEVFSRERILHTDHIKDIGDIEGSAVTIDQSPGFEVTATAKDLQTGIPMEIYQVIVVRDNTYFIVQGLVEAESAEKYFPVFRKVANGMTFVE